MIVYGILLFLIIFNSFFFRKNKKIYIVSSFIILFLVQSLRKYTVGIDLLGHYSSNYIKFASMNWSEIFNLCKAGSSYYDAGFIIFMKGLSLISKNVQWFIIATSAINCGLIGRYIYKHSENYVMETILFIASYSYFMYMNIIAQSIAISIILFGYSYLENKKIFKYIITVLIASLIHSSAIIGLIFIPLFYLKNNKSNIRKVIILSFIGVLFINNIMPFILKYIFPQFAFYFKNKNSSMMDGIRIVHLLLYFLFFIIGYYYIYIKNKENYNREDSGKKGSFLLYMTIISVACRFLVSNSYIFSRMGFYFYPFSYSLVAYSMKKETSKKLLLRNKLLLYFILLFTFIILLKTLETSYGVLPYKFYWE